MVWFQNLSPLGHTLKKYNKIWSLLSGSMAVLQIYHRIKERSIASLAFLRRWVGARYRPPPISVKKRKSSRMDLGGFEKNSVQKCRELRDIAFTACHSE